MKILFRDMNKDKAIANFTVDIGRTQHKLTDKFMVVVGKTTRESMMWEQEADLVVGEHIIRNVLLGRSDSMVASISSVPCAPLSTSRNNS